MENNDEENSTNQSKKKLEIILVKENETEDKKMMKLNIDECFSNDKGQMEQQSRNYINADGNGQTRMLVAGKKLFLIVVNALIACILISLGAIQVKFVISAHPLEIALVRMLVQLILAAVEMLFRRVPLQLIPGKQLCIFLRGISEAAVFGLLYMSFYYIQVADAVSLNYTAPAFCILFACILMRKFCDMLESFMIIMALTGVVLISRPACILPVELLDPEPNHYLGVTLGLGAAVVTAIIEVAISTRLNDVPQATTLLYSSFYGMAPLAIACLAMSALTLPKSMIDLLWMLGSGFCASLGHIMLTRAMQIADSSATSVLKSLGVVFVYVLQAVVLQESPHWLSLVGAVFVVSPAIVLEVKKTSSEQQEKHWAKEEDDHPVKAANCCMNPIDVV